MNARDDLMHEALSSIGPDLPEPTAPARVRESIEAMACPTPIVRTGLWRRAGVGVLGFAAALFAVVSAVMYVQNVRLTRDLAAARGDQGGAVTTAAHQPPLVAMSFYNDQCPVAQAVAPRFEAMKAAHCDNEVLFVTVDVSTSKEAQAAKLVEAIGCNFVMTCQQAPEITSGTVLLADMRSQSVISACRGADCLGEVETALGEALMTCEGP